MSPRLSVLSRAASFWLWTVRASLATALLAHAGGIAAEGPIEPQLEVGVDRPGSDYRNFDLSQPDAKLCRASCERDQTCRAWTYVRPGHQGPIARCWLKNDVPQPVSRSCCTSGFINPLHVIQACRAIGNIAGDRPVTCVDPGGRDFGKAGKTFLSGDKVMILARFRRLYPGEKEISAVYSRWQNGRFLNFSGNRKTVQFRNSSESWAFWFPARFIDKGRWRVHVAVSGKGLTGQVLGTVEYCVGCSLE